VQTPLNASASTAGALLSSSTFEVPKFQREYSWQSDEVADFWNDLRNNIDSETYFLGLIILTDQDGRKHVVDGQQRILTLSLLANAIYHEALSRGRRALADRIQADFLHSIDYDSDKTAPRVVLSDNADNATFQELLATGEPPADEKGTLAFLRRSILARSITPEIDGVLHMIWTPQASAWEGMGEEDGAFWRSTIGNTFLSKSDRRPKSATDWDGFKEFILETAIPGEWLTRFKKVEQWDETEVANVGLELAKVAGKTWYQ